MPIAAPSRCLPPLTLAWSLTLGVAPAVAQSPLTIGTVSPPRADSAVLSVLSRGDQVEVALTTLALPKLHDPAVRRLAQMNLDEHTVDLAAATAIAAHLGLPVEPKVVPAGEAAAITDSLYLSEVVARHRALLAQLPADGSAVSDDRLQHLLSDSRRGLERHLEEALKLQRGLGAAAR